MKKPDLRTRSTGGGFGTALTPFLRWSPAVVFLLAAGAADLQAQDEEASRQVTLEILEGRDRSLSAYPFAYYTPETEFAFGAGGIVTFYTSRVDRILRPSKATVSGYYSTRGQYSFSQETELYFDENNLLIQLPFSFGSFVDKYWGAGNQAQDVPGVNYDVNVVELGVVVEGATPLEGFARDGIVYRGSYRDITDVKENPFLTDETVGLEGGFTSGFGFDLVDDSRDATFYPTDGGYHRLYFVWYAPVFGSDYRYNQVEVDLREYMSLGHGQVLAFQLYGDMVFGDPPFYELPALGGGSLMRGYYQGRYRDVNYIAGQMEYRSPRWWRLSAVGFAGIGDVFGNSGSDVSFSRIKPSWGGGLRFLFDQTQGINLRMDVGFGRDGSSGVYFGLEEAF